MGKPPDLARFVIIYFEIKGNGEARSFSLHILDGASRRTTQSELSFRPSIIPGFVVTLRSERWRH